jgi:Ca2+-binding RTX toxin-like protein
MRSVSPESGERDVKHAVFACAGDFEALFDWSALAGAPGLPLVLNGDRRDNVLTGGDLADFIKGKRGNDKIFGGDGDDDLRGGAGLDAIHGGEGDDDIRGDAGADSLFGEDGDDFIRGGGGGDSVDGGAGDDDLRGGAGADSIAGGAGRDMIRGGQGDDWIESGRGDDEVRAGAGADTILSLSWGGEPEIAQDPGAEKVEPGEPLTDDDLILPGRGADTLIFRWLLDAREEILDKHRDPETGDVDYRAVAGENGAAHDHWVEYGGDKVVKGYDPDEDTLVFEGHTLRLRSAELVDADGDRRADDTVLTFYSEQGGAGAHQGDHLGTVTFLNAEIAAEDVTTNAGVFYGVEDPFSAGG